jgi:hypothetical protein
MRWFALFLAALPVIGFAEGIDNSRLCQAAQTEGELAAEIERMADAGVALPSGESILMLACGDASLLDRLIVGQYAENLEYVVIDMGTDVNRPLVPQEGGKLTVMQYLIQQSVLAPSDEARAFAADYMHELRDVDFNPNLLSLSMK